MGDLFCALDVGKSCIDEMSLSIFLDLEDGPDESLDHRFVIDETLPGLAFGLVDAGLNVGVVKGVAWVHSNYYIIFICRSEQIIPGILSGAVWAN